MLIMTQDRVSGLSADKTPLGSYGPGNTRDDSNRNSWVSSDGTDKLSIDCLGQVNGLFLGRYQADSIKLTYQGDNLFSNKTSTGFVSVGYSNTSNGVLTGVVDSAPVANPGGYFYSSGSLVTIRVDQNSNFINVDDLIEITNNATLAGNHRVVQVQKGSSFTRLNSSGNSEVFQEQGSTGEKIQIIVSTSPNDLPGNLSGSSLSFQSGLSIDLLTAGVSPNIIAGTISDDDDVLSIYRVKFSIASSSLLKTGDSPFKVGEYVSFEDCRIETSVNSILCENLDYSSNYDSYYVSFISSDNLSFDVFVKPNTFFAKNLVQVISANGNPKVRFGTTFFYSGGGYQHKLGLSLIAGATTTAGVEVFENNEVIELFNPVISTNTKNPFNVKQITLNTISQEFLHSAIVKDRSQFSIKLPFRVRGGSPFVDTAFAFGTSDSIELRKYVVDTSDASTTTEGIGTPIRRTDITTRTQNTIADFVSGKISKVESTYIPLPREAFPTKIIIEMDATLNHNAANLFNQFLLEEVYLEKPSATSLTSSDYITTSDVSDLNETSYYTSVNTYLYNSNDDGELTLNFSADTTIVAGDYIYLKWPNNIAAQNSTITKSLDSNPGSSTATMMKMATTVHELYEGMKVAGSSDKYIVLIDKTANEVTTNIAHGLSDGDSVTFDHHPSLGDDASLGWTGIHKVKSSSSNGRTITFIVPNSSTRGDLTINSNSNPQSASAAYVIKVKNGRGRFVRPITTTISSADSFLWNSGSNDIDYVYSGETYTISAGTARLFFSSSHSLVNNDKIILYDVTSSVNGSDLKGLDSSYLITYGSSDSVTINIKKASSSTISALSGDSTGSNRLIIVTSSNHGLSVGETISLNKMPTTPTGLSSVYTVETTPTAKSFTVIVKGSPNTIPSNYSQSIPSGCEVISGVHKLSFGSTYSTNSTSSIISDIPCVRSISISDAISAFENPIQVGNLIYRDGLQSSDSQYNAVNVTSVVFPKTPIIDDATSTTPYRSDSDTAIQNTFAGTENSVVSQIKIVRGDGTTQFDIHLQNPFGTLNKPVVFTKLLQGLRVAILRAGVSRSLPNPQVGVSNNFKDYSIRKELPTGAYYYLNRDSAKEFSGRISSTPDNTDVLVDFGAEQLARPFPCLIISGNEGNMKKLRNRTALYGYFTSLPQATFNNKLNNLKDASFSIREVL